MAEDEEVDAPSAPSCWDGEVEEMSKAMSEARLKKQEEDENDYYSEEFPSLEAATERQKKWSYSWRWFLLDFYTRDLMSDSANDFVAFLYNVPAVCT